MSYVSFSTHTHHTHFFVQIWAKRLLKIMYTRQHTFFDKHLYILYVMPLNCLLFKCTNSKSTYTNTHIHTHGHDEEHEEHEQAGKKKEKLQTHYIIEMSCLLLLMVYFLLLSFHFVSFAFECVSKSRCCRRPRCIKFRGDAYIYKLLERWPRMRNKTKNERRLFGTWFDIKHYWKTKISSESAILPERYCYTNVTGPEPVTEFSVYKKTFRTFFHPWHLSIHFCLLCSFFSDTQSMIVILLLLCKFITIRLRCHRFHRDTTRVKRKKCIFILKLRLKCRLIFFKTINLHHFAINYTLYVKCRFESS